jgi:hypothetical protein
MISLSHMVSDHQRLQSYSISVLCDDGPSRMPLYLFSSLSINSNFMHLPSAYHTRVGVRWAEARKFLKLEGHACADHRATACRESMKTLRQSTCISACLNVLTLLKICLCFSIAARCKLSYLAFSLLLLSAAPWHTLRDWGYIKGCSSHAVDRFTCSSRGSLVQEWKIPTPFHRRLRGQTDPGSMNRRPLSLQN